MICIEIEIEIQQIQIYWYISINYTTDNSKENKITFGSILISTYYVHKISSWNGQYGNKKAQYNIFILYIDGTFLQVVNICYINASNKENYTVCIS